jgi:hypothetical protein
MLSAESSRRKSDRTGGKSLKPPICIVSTREAGKDLHTIASQASSSPPTPLSGQLSRQHHEEAQGSDFYRPSTSYDHQHQKTP